MQMPLKAISPIDGRYHQLTDELKEFFSEYALIKYRVIVEIEWFKTVISVPEVQGRISTKPLNAKTISFLQEIVVKFNEDDAEHIKSIEQKTKHDIKSIEYFLREKFSTQSELKPLIEYIHFGVTSEDINNLAYGLMLKEAKEKCLLPSFKKLMIQLVNLTEPNANISMLSRTHGQVASTTTVGKEFANFVARLQKQLEQLDSVSIMGKLNGSVGNFNAFYIAFPQVNWLEISQKFVEQLGLVWNPVTTQIEPHDYIAEFCHALIRCNNILLDLNRDIWGYIALNYFSKKSTKDEIGSSVMPHKINPIEFENAEGNLGIANALLDHFANKLPISRWQRDLSDSTVMRNLGVAFAHLLIALISTLNGLQKIEVNKKALASDLDQHWEILAEAVQTVMRSYGVANSYEKLKELTHGKNVSKEQFLIYINSLLLSNDEKKSLLNLTPEKYTGIADYLAKKLAGKLNNML